MSLAALRKAADTWFETALFADVRKPSPDSPSTWRLMPG